MQVTYTFMYYAFDTFYVMSKLSQFSWCTVVEILFDKKKFCSIKFSVL